MSKELIAIAALWSIWLAGNWKVFEDITIPQVIVMKQCVSLIKIWAHRANKDELHSINMWIAHRPR